MGRDGMDRSGSTLALAERYLGDANANPPEPAEIKRLIVRVIPTKVTEFKVSA